MARLIAKSQVKNGFRNRCHVQIHVNEAQDRPATLYIDTYNSNLINDIKDQELVKIVERNFDQNTNNFCKLLDLKKPIFKKTSAKCHFTSQENLFSWEKYINLQHENPSPSKKKLTTKDKSLLIQN